MTVSDQPDLLSSVQTVQGYWQMGILWSPLVSGEQTKGQYSIMEQLMPVAAGPPRHVHEQGDEVFYLLDGEMAMQIGDKVIVASQGQMVRVPAGTTHAFAVKSETARVLNFYVPAGLDLQVAMLGTPATAATLPPEGAQRPPSEEAQEAFSSRLHDLATQTMAADSDLLGDYRAGTPGDGPMP